MAVSSSFEKFIPKMGERIALLVEVAAEQ